MIKEFKEFILRGNVIDLAVGVVIGSALHSDCHQFGRRSFNTISFAGIFIFRQRRCIFRACLGA